MKKIGAIILAAIFFLFTAAPVFALESAPPAVTANTYVVMDAATGQILVQQGAAQTSFPASITKIMTMALAMEQCGGDLTGQVTVSAAAVAAVENGSSYVALQPGEVVSLADVFHATVLMSANDGANVLAEYVSGSIDAFVERMNQKAAELGMVKTHFTNPSGWHNDVHETTAQDMAKLTQWALTVPGFKELLGAVSYTMQPTNKQSEQRLFGTDNVMLVESQMTYEGTIGGKSGWTQEAGYTMVEVVQRNDRTLIVVVMGCEKKYGKFKDCIALLDYCFGNFTLTTMDCAALAPPEIPVLYQDGVIGNVPLEASATFWLHQGYTAQDVQAAYALPEQYVPSEAFSGSVSLSLKEETGAMNTQIVSAPVSVNPGALAELMNHTGAQPVSAGSTGSVLRSVLGVLLGILGLLMLLVAARIAYVAHIKAKRRKARAARRNAKMRAQRRAQQQRSSPHLQVIEGGRAPQYVRTPVSHTQQDKN